MMKRLSFALAVVALIGAMPAVNAQQLTGTVAVDEPGTSFWLKSPVGSDDRGRFLRFVTDHRLHQDNMGLRNRDFENWSVDAFHGSASASMGTKTRGFAAAARASQTRHMTANRAIYITGPWF